MSSHEFNQRCWAVHLVGGDDSPKLASAADEIAAIWVRHRDDEQAGSERRGALQVVMCDQGTPHSATDTRSYGRLRTMLVARGIPARRIRFVHEATTDKARAGLFAECREGAVDVLIGSTPKLGMGTNIQTRLVALHHLDAPWLPSEIEQREGRAIRPLNNYSTVLIRRYVTEGTFDAMMWETLQRKARFISAFLAAGSTEREIEDVSDAVLSFGQVKALAAGRPELLRQAELTSDVQRLRIARSVWSQQVRRATREADQLRKLAARMRSGATRIADELRVAVSRDEGVSCGIGEAVINAVQETRRWAAATTRSWRGVELVVGRGERGTGDVALRHRWYTYDEVTVPRSTVRRGAAAVERFVLDWAGAYLDSLEEQEAQLLADAARSEGRADELEAFADHALFERQDALDAAERELAGIERDLEELASREGLAKAA